MSPSAQDLEQEIEESRARLDLTIDRIQDRLTVSGIADDLMGTVREAEFGSVFDTALDVVRRNPLPVLLIAAGASWLAWRMAQEARRPRARFHDVPTGEEIPVLNTGEARVNDPDLSPRHPTQDLAETPGEISTSTRAQAASTRSGP